MITTANMPSGTSAVADPTDRLSAIAAAVHDFHASARAHELAKWDAYLSIGRLLIEARELIVGDGQFGQWCADQRFPFNRQWRHLLQTVAWREADVRTVLSTAVDRDGGIGVRAMVERLRELDGVGRPSQITEDAGVNDAWIDDEALHFSIAGTPYSYRPADAATRAEHRRLVDTDADSFATTLADFAAVARTEQQLQWLEAGCRIIDPMTLWRLGPEERERWARADKRVRDLLDAAGVQLRIGSIKASDDRPPTASERPSGERMGVEATTADIGPSGPSGAATGG